MHVIVTLGVRHSSGDWDNDYDGRVDLLLVTFHEPEFSTVVQPPVHDRVDTGRSRAGYNRCVKTSSAANQVELVGPTAGQASARRFARFVELFAR